MAMALRSCGLFLKISFDRALFLETPKYHPHGEFKVWPQFKQTPRGISLDRRSEMVKQVNLLLDRDRFCSPCRQFREDGRYETAMQALQGTLWCSHCEKVHKRPLFSARQRTVSSATRICVLVGKAQFCGHLSSGWDSLQRGDFPDKHPCRHRDHDPPWPTRLKDSLRGFRSWGFDRPHVRSIKDLGPNPGGACRGPISTVTCFIARLHHRAPVTRAWLQEQLEARADILDKMLCPHVTARDGQLLLPFGPDRCACFQSPRWIDHHEPGAGAGLDYGICCRCKAAKSPRRAGYFLPERSLDHYYSCFVCWTSYDWRRNGSTVYLEIRNSNGLYRDTLPSRPSFFARKLHWLYVLHPESWGIMDDEELRHVAWCDDINCSTRWRWESLARLWKDTA